MRRVVIALITLIGCSTLAAVPVAARQSAPPTIHRVTLQPDSGVLTIAGAHLGPELIVTVDGQLVSTLPGATAERLEVLAPASVLSTPGTYRLTVVDPVRRTWDGFIVASAPAAAGGGAAAAITGSAAPVAVAPAARGSVAMPTVDESVSPPAAFAPRPLSVIEDSATPFRTALGSLALSSNTFAGTDNTATGYQAMRFNTTGSGNTAVGSEALRVNTTGSANTAVGHAVLDANTDGDQNVALGIAAMASNTNGSQNVALGGFALSANTVGGQNVAIGYNAAGSVSGSQNIHIGANVTGLAADTHVIRLGLPFDSQTFSGQNATYIAGIRGTTVTGGEGVYIDVDGRLGSGPVVPAANSVGSAQVIADSLTAADLATASVGTAEIADGAVSAADLGAASVGTAEIVDGAVTAADIAPASVGTSEIADGAVTSAKVAFTFAGLGANTFAGTQQIAGGNVDLPASTASLGSITKSGARFLHNAGAQNTFLGETAGTFGVAGAANTGLGHSALTALTTGARNTATGSGALLGLTIGTGNTATGYLSLFDTTGSMNTAVGHQAGRLNTTGSHNIFIGAGVDGAASDAHTLRLGKAYDPNAAGGPAGQNRAFIAGVAGTVLTTPAVQVFVDANGQLGTLVPPPVTGTINVPVQVSPVPDTALQQELAAQRARLDAQNARIDQLLAEIRDLRAEITAQRRRR